MSDKEKESESIHFPTLAEAVTLIVGKAASAGQIRQRTGLTRTTANQLAKGRKVSEATLERFARGYSVPTNPLRIAMGLDPLPIDPTSSVRESNQFEVLLPDGKSVVIAGIAFDRDEQEILTRLIRHFAAEPGNTT